MVHIHRYFCLGCDPEIIKFAGIVLKACMTEFNMYKYHGWEFIDSQKMSFPENSISFDEWMSDDELKGKQNVVFM